MPYINKFFDDPLFHETVPGLSLKNKPLGFIDIGARGGVLDDVAPLAGVTAALAFEPDKNECSNINENSSENLPYAQLHIAPYAVGKIDGSARMNLFTTPSNNSFLNVNRPAAGRYNITTFTECGTEIIPVTSLDSYLFEKLSGEDYWGELLKLDTQGLEHDILQGAQRTLSERTVAVVAEVEFFQMYVGQPLFSEVELLLRSYGFSFYGFTKMSYRSCRQLDKRDTLGRERVLWADAVFFKDPFPGGFFTGQLTERQNHALFACALLLGYFDFALEVALKSWAQGEEIERIKTFVSNCAAFPPDDARSALLDLARRVEENPRMANVEIGRFVDQHRFTWDYDDVAKTN
ncbi:MAG: FkbM family methyltransferase [Geobacteraceae bacterium]|nr:FkbM family methyltransferase [Geobacteraceae bacterium]NTW79393.1 FkbM family methyltransferase [Geobacteraceae bacterium]